MLCWATDRQRPEAAKLGSDLHVVLQTHVQGREPVVAPLDANARVGSVLSDSVELWVPRDRRELHNSFLAPLPALVHLALTQLSSLVPAIFWITTSDCLSQSHANGARLGFHSFPKCHPGFVNCILLRTIGTGSDS